MNICDPCLPALNPQACNAYGVTTVPLYDTLTADALEYIVNEVELATVLCGSAQEVQTLLVAAPQCPSLTCIIMMDNKATAAHLTTPLAVYNFQEVEAAGTESPQPPSPPEPNDLATICYTSGTTGDPKGAILSHRNIVSVVAGTRLAGLAMSTGDVHLSYLPLAHMFERIVQCALWFGGAAVGFFRGDTQLLTEDLFELKPTVFPSVPRLYNRIYDAITQGVEKSGWFSAKIFQTAQSAKTYRLLKNGTVDNQYIDPIVFSKLTKRLGLENCRLMITGSAPIAPHVMQFLRVSFACATVEGYGSTECAAACTITNLHDQATVGHVGGPLPCVELCLVDVPELGYLSTDTKHEGFTVTGRGEVCYRGPSIFQGYLKQPEQTAEALDSEGWYHSGDIGVWLPTGALKIVDRKKNIFKLSQGEYVAAEKIENVLLKSAYVEQIFLYGNSFHSFTVAIIVPDEPSIQHYFDSVKKRTPSRVEACQDPDFNAEVLRALTQLGKDSGLAGFEIPKAVHLAAEPFSVEANTLTPTFKLKRNEAQKVHQNSIDQMYAAEAVGGQRGLKQQTWQPSKL